MVKHTILKNYFGYDSFRLGQEELIDNILSNRDVLGIMPTGSGKSICYQVPAMCMPGITIVVSPLISLMKDQVQSLVQSGIPAAYINSALTYSQMNKALENAKKGDYKIIYVAPERLDTKAFIDFAKNADISMLTVDEAHCISQWGQDFRPSYLKICDFLKALPKRPVISAFTATATSQVQRDICSILELNNPSVTMTGFNRPNLYFEVRHPKKKYDELIDYIRLNKGKSGIVYCLTRKTVEQVTAKLIKDGINATRYHAGLSDIERSENQDNFLYDRSDVIVATNAFGMGIDKSNVGYVVHYNMPKDIESYYQEAGRAGRDGADAECVLLYSAGDVHTCNLLIDAESHYNESISAETRENLKSKALSRLQQMNFYCHTTNCLREYILNYFGESNSGSCGNCGNCRGDMIEIDVLDDCKIIADCIKSLNRNYGRKMICSILKGKHDQRIVDENIQLLPAFGALKSLSADEINSRISLMISEKYISISNDKYAVLTAGVNIFDLEGRKQPLIIKTLPKPIKKDATTQKDSGLFGALKAERMRIAKELGVPAFVVFADATLMDMCLKMPENEKEMLEVSGVGNAKLKKYGKAFLKVIREYK